MKGEVRVIIIIITGVRSSNMEGEGYGHEEVKGGGNRLQV